MRNATRHLFFIAATSLAQVAAALDCDRAAKLYAQGLAAGKNGNMTLAVDRLSESLNACETFESAYLLGQAQQSLGDPAAAQAAFEHAQRFAADEDALALALGRYAEARDAQDDPVEALAVIQEARALHSAPPAWMDELALRLDTAQAEQPLQLAQVTRALTLPRRAFEIRERPADSDTSYAAGAYPSNPSLDVRLNFEFDSTALDSASRSNIDVLARAMVQPTLAGKRFLLIGHTDVRGDLVYNEQLSRRRASAVLAALVAREPQLRGRLSSDGAGESRPLYRGSSEREHRLNRRLEVVVR